jgi:hypothetical protein
LDESIRTEIIDDIMAGSFVIRQSKTILPLFEIALVLVPFDHVASFTINADHGIIRAVEFAESGWTSGGCAISIHKQQARPLALET